VADQFPPPAALAPVAPTPQAKRQGLRAGQPELQLSAQQLAVGLHRTAGESLQLQAGGFKAHAGGLEQPPAHVHPGRLLVGIRPPQPPVLPLAVGAQIHAHPREAEVHHRQPAPQAAEGVHAQAETGDLHAGGVVGVRQQAGGTQLQAGPAQALIRAQLKRVAQHGAQLALQPRLQADVEPSGQLVERRNPRHGNGCAAASQQQWEEGAGANGKATGAWGAI